MCGNVLINPQAAAPKIRPGVEGENLKSLEWCVVAVVGGALTRGRSLPRHRLLTFDFCLSTSIPVLTTSTCVVAWPQGDQFLGGDL